MDMSEKDIAAALGVELPESAPSGTSEEVPEAGTQVAGEGTDAAAEVGADQGAGTEGEPGDTGDGAGADDAAKNAAAAARRRSYDRRIAREREAARQSALSELSSTIAKLGLKDPVTGEIVTNASELEAYKNHMAEKAAGGTGKARGEASELSDAAAAARAAVAELKAERRRADDERRAEEFSAEIAKITALNPEIKGAEDLEALAEYDEIVALVARGYSPYDAYRTIYYDRDMAAAVSRGERQARAANASKAHLVPDKNTGSETGVAVPSEVRDMYREMMPGITDAEIDAAYKKYAAETNK